MAVSASDVMKLRKMSGQGMMDCKKALGETGGDVEKAMEMLRKKGLATMAKRAGRETSEGRVIVKASDDSKTVAMASLCCETDFVAKSDDFAATLEVMSNYMMACDANEGTEALNETAIDSKKLAEVITDAVAKTGEKTEVGDYAKFSVDGNSVVGTYIHFNGKTGAMVVVEADNADVASSDDMKVVANDIAMHVTAAKPVAVDRDAVDAALIAKEREIAAEQMKGKPAEIIDKIVDGKMNKFFADNCLVDQKFVKNEELTISKLVTETAKKLGGGAKVTKMVRVDIS